MAEEKRCPGKGQQDSQARGARQARAHAPAPMAKRLFEACVTACMSSCGETCPLKLYGDQILRTSIPNCCTSADWTDS